MRAIPNQYAALRIEGEQDRRADGIYDLMNGIGAHEVIVETPDHDAHIAEYPAGKTIEVLTMYRDRARDLQGDQRFRYIQLFRNHGMSAGAPISHPHSQLIALPITPRWVKEELVCAKSHWQSKERCLFCDILRQEERDGSRIVWQNGDFLSFAPFAAKFPFETWILPRRHSCEFNRTEDRELGPLAETICNTLWAIRAALNDPPFNYIIHSAPRLTPDRYAAGAISIEKDYHWHIEVIPRVTRMAGFEWGTGFYINPTLPETAAAYLREMLEERKREQG
ncbi:MAG: Galactose-1-phosphate uridylyltransferase [candidate division BRC1 bacterium ADurb.BinA364]|nr:MAG: Galactose-1-phosphate uridylyltransferase [candidate division BRC1 bacterium ADurb.BinA364]